MGKKVIFVGGTSYSGSTFFHLTLANDPKGFAVGEVKHLFRPTTAWHVSPDWMCGCKDPDCRLWERVRRNGEAHLYETIFDIHPEVDFIVVSSKNIVWIDGQTDRLARQGIEARHVAIWKTPAEFAHSLHKRNLLQKKNGAELANWPRYYSTFYSFVPAFRTVKYASYMHQQSQVLESACERLDIPYFAGKEAFWQKRHHVLGGNPSARIHLLEKKSDQYEGVMDSIRNLGQPGIAADTHRQLYYENPDEQVVQIHVDKLRRETPHFDMFEEMLTAHDVVRAGPPDREWPELRLGPIEMRLRRLRQLRRDGMGKLKYSR